MINVTDLHIEDEILPLLDFTHNDFSKKVLIDIVAKPLGSVEDILLRQDILKGFIANSNILRDYSYSRVDFLEVHDFLKKFSIQTTQKSLKLPLLFSEKERHQKRGKLTQLVLLFHKLHSFYLTRLDTKPFPEAYKKELKNLSDFLSGFDLIRYELLIREQRFRVRHIVEVTALLSQKAKDGHLATFWERYFLFEAYLSVSIGITRHGFIFPAFSETAFSLNHFYHPLLTNPVKNSFTTGCNVILLTGPNMSGKSTFLKAVSLCVYLGHIGLAVPASKAEIPFFSTISVAINLNDDIVNGFSHFMTEVINLKKVVIEASNNAKCFAVFDELFRGTNIEDAIEISARTIKGVTNFKKSVFLISTHLHALKEMDEVKTNKVATWFIDCELNDNNPIFTYILKEGWSDLKVGCILFEKEGLNDLLSV